MCRGHLFLYLNTSGAASSGLCTACYPVGTIERMLPEKMFVCTISSPCHPTHTFIYLPLPSLLPHKVHASRQRKNRYSYSRQHCLQSTTLLPSLTLQNTSYIEPCPRLLLQWFGLSRFIVCVRIHSEMFAVSNPRLCQIFGTTWMETRTTR